MSPMVRRKLDEQARSPLQIRTHSNIGPHSLLRNDQPFRRLGATSAKGCIIFRKGPFSPSNLTSSSCRERPCSPMARKLSKVAA